MVHSSLNKIFNLSSQQKYSLFLRIIYFWSVFKSQVSTIKIPNKDCKEWRVKQHENIPRKERQREKLDLLKVKTRWKNICRNNVNILSKFSTKQTRFFDGYSHSTFFDGYSHSTFLVAVTKQLL